MSAAHHRPGSPGRRWVIRAPQNFAGGSLLIALAILALSLTQGLPQGTLRSMGPAMLPDWLAVGVGLSGLALVASSFLTDGEPLERWSLRGVIFIMLAIIGFAITIRPFVLGPIAIPGLGLVVAGPLAIIVSGYATNEARLRELVILALSLTPFCMLLFGDLLNLPIPIFPQSLVGLFPADWSQKDVLRATAVIMIVAAAVVFFVGRRKHAQGGVAAQGGSV
ncbi:tripartite tricarboxylate transporter TctB family protein [Microvirga terricola]|uniref:Tripartite tricarboxylate transporter TctB family protein n=1 Tax=Microvirga terricola TaxID=2719797 RepID=A0ABX0VE33_9HYPH|nr:tripartite tricarboxylate transporter TctB family protein [Microvirga terricola]NIX78092.1 tripartite tricarboxylate transporter TctB family protein [Microvirga terricola]